MDNVIGVRLFIQPSTSTLPFIPVAPCYTWSGKCVISAIRCQHLFEIMGRTNWNDESSRKLLIIINEEKNKGVSKYSWPNIAKIYNAQTGSTLEGKQISNHYNDLKEKFKIWEELQKLTGIAYNPVTGLVDVAESSLERYKQFLQRNPKYGLKVVKDRLANTDELSKLFNGKLAHGVGGCFSPAMAKGASYLTKGVENLTINDDSEDNEKGDNINDEDVNLSSSDSPQQVAQNATQTNNRKRKGESNIESSESKRRQDSLDNVIKLLTDIGTSSVSSKTQRISDELTRLEIAEKNGDDYFVKAIKYFSDEKHADSFLALKNDNQKWIYLRDMEIESLFN